MHQKRFRDSSAFQYIKGTARGDQVRTELEAVSKKRRHTRLSKLCVGITVNAEGSSPGSAQPPILRGPWKRAELGSAEGRVTAIAACRTCGTEPRVHARFCHGCGSPIQDGDSHAEYKQVTVLFADVVHSMDIASVVGAERLREIMAAGLLYRAAGVVKRYGGTVDKFTGDGIMAVFGAPVALEDHALRACRAALEIHRAVSDLADEVSRRDGVDLRLRLHPRPARRTPANLVCVCVCVCVCDRRGRFGGGDIARGHPDRGELGAWAWLEADAVGGCRLLGRGARPPEGIPPPPSCRSSCQFGCWNSGSLFTSQGQRPSNFGSLPALVHPWGLLNHHMFNILRPAPAQHHPAPPPTEFLCQALACPWWACWQHWPWSQSPPPASLGPLPAHPPACEGSFAAVVVLHGQG